MAAYRFAYISLLIFAAVFSQVYSGPLSSVILLTFIFLPLISLLIAVLERAFFKLSIDNNPVCIEKGSSLKLQLTVKNMFFLPLSCVYITASLPDTKEKNEARLFFSVAPFNKRNLNICYVPTFRGEYEFSAESVYFYDILKLFKLKKKYNIKKQILITPKIYSVDACKNQFSDTDEESFIQSSDFSGGERSFVRKYTDGDEIKRIHWKLSSKQEDYMVWQSIKNKVSQVRIICDMSNHGLNETENALFSDAVLEAAFAISLFNIRHERHTILSYYDCTNKLTQEIAVSNISELYKTAETAAKIKNYYGDPDFFRLAKESFGNENKNSDIVLITHTGDQSLARLTEKLSETEGFTLVLIGNAESETDAYIRKFKNVNYAVVKPENFFAEISQAISNIYGA